MSEQEYQVLDELYFVQSFPELRQLTGFNESELKEILGELLKKGWIKCLRSREGEEPVGESEFFTNYTSYLYLASKAGLQAHNSR